MELKNKTIINEHIVLSDNTVNVLGPDLVLKDCEIISELNNHRSLIIAGVELTGGSFIHKGTLSDCKLSNAIFNKVRFIGKFSGWDFGNWDKQDYINECNFKEALLNGCRFLNCNINKMIFPPWPCFTIPKSSSKAEQIAQIDWPGDWDIIMEEAVDTEEECSAITDNVDDLIPEYGGEKPNLKRKISTIPGVIL